jgi:hypothetical protein
MVGTLEIGVRIRGLDRIHKQSQRKDFVLITGYHKHCDILFLNRWGIKGEHCSRFC